MSRKPLSYLPVPWLIPRGPESLGDLSAMGGGVNWPASNRAIYQPFSLPLTKLVKSMSVWFATASGNFDIGLYDSDCVVRLVSQGAASVSTGFSTFSFPVPILLEAGLRYYAGLVCSATPQVVKWDTPAGNLRVAGLAQEALGATTLPATATPAQIASALQPCIVLDFEQ